MDPWPFLAGLYGLCRVHMGYILSKERPRIAGLY